jgi:DNA (cytosine-5)-methyltransferase 1
MKVFSMFSGIGGFELGFINALGVENVEFVGHSEIDKYANQVYSYRFNGVKNYGDARSIIPEELPDFDILCGGFPCQAFSVAGNRRGFEDARGTLFYEIARIARSKRPRYLLLENVKGLVNHEKGKTLATILEIIWELGYEYQFGVLNSRYFGVPQNRERIIIVANLRGEPKPEVFPFGEADGTVQQVPGKARYQSSTSTPEVGQARRIYGTEGLAPPLNVGWTPHIPVIFNRKEGVKKETSVSTCLSASDYRGLNRNQDQTAIVSPCITTENAHIYGANVTPGQSLAIYQAMLTPNRVKKRQNGRRVKNPDEAMFSLTAQDIHGVIKTVGYIPEEDRPKGNYLPRERVISDEGISRAVTTSQSQFPWYQCKQQIRRLTPVECERLQGFPDNWTSMCKDTQRYKQLGNAVTVNVIEAVVKRMFKVKE